MVARFAVIFLCFAASAFAQVRIEPEAPRWGATLTVIVPPRDGLNKSEQVFAMLYTHHAGTPMNKRLTTALKWDGARFVGQFTIPDGCTSGGVWISTLERLPEIARAYFMCRDAGGALPPGALITGLYMGARNPENAKADIEADLARLTNPQDKGWAYFFIFALRNRLKMSPEDLRSEVESLERAGPERQTAALMSSLVVGYSHLDERPRAFAKFAQLCERYPESPFTVDVGLVWASAHALRYPEYDDELRRLRALVANRAPQNPALRAFVRTLATDTPGVSADVVKQIVRSWIADEPQEMKPYFLLASILAKEPNGAAGAEDLVTKSIELSYRPQFLEFARDRLRNDAYRLRSKLKAARGDVAGAIADAKMAQLTDTKTDTSEDTLAEAELWARLGHANRAEAVAVDAFHRGSLRAEKFLKEGYVERTGSDRGFGDYLVERLRSGNLPGKSLRSAPAFAAQTLDGKSVSPDALRGQIVVVDFWFIGCPPCRVERPLLNAIVEEVGNRVRFVGFALDSPEQLTTFLKENPFTFEIVAESEKIAGAFGVHAYPTHLLIDRQGNVVWESTGGRPEDIERLRAMIYRVLARSE